MIVTKPNVLGGNLRLGARDNFHDACGDGTVGSVLSKSSGGSLSTNGHLLHNDVITRRVNFVNSKACVNLSAAYAGTINS